MVLDEPADRSAPGQLACLMSGDVIVTITLNAALHVAYTASAMAEASLAGDPAAAPLGSDVGDISLNPRARDLGL